MWLWIDPKRNWCNQRRSPRDASLRGRRLGQRPGCFRQCCRGRCPSCETRRHRRGASLCLRRCCERCLGSCASLCLRRCVRRCFGRCASPCLRQCLKQCLRCWVGGFRTRRRGRCTSPCVRQCLRRCLWCWVGGFRTRRRGRCTSRCSRCGQLIFRPFY